MMAPALDADPESTSTPPWTRLQLSRRRTKSDLPPLFYRLITPEPTSTANALRLILHCTDLTILYTASLTHADILAEATRQHAPIDPSESSKQFAVLLEYLAQSLDGKDNVLARTPASEDHLALEAADEGDFSAEMSAQLALRTTISLPRPLRPLSFAFALTRQEPAAFSRVVLRPALEGTQMVNRKVEALLDVVRDKDHVIARLLERVGNQASGDMSLVFPTLTGRRGRGGEKVGVEEAGRLVPGLREFEFGEWERERGFEHGGGFEGLVKEGGLAETLGGEERIGAWVRHLPGPEALERYGDDMNGKRRLSRQVTRDTTRGSQADRDNDDEEDDDATESEDEFERQPTPPSTRKTTGSTKTTPQKSAATAQQASGNPSSSDKDDSGPPAKKQKTSGGNIGSGKRAGRLGGLRGGRNKPAERTVSSSPEQDAAPTAIPAAIKDNDEGEKRRPSTASTATASATDSEAEPPPPTTRSSKAQKKGGDGGKREPTPPTASPSPEPAPSEAPSSGKKKGRLGRLGGRDKGRTTDPRSSSVEASDGTATTGRHKLGKLGGARCGTKQADAPAPDPAAEEMASEDGDATATAGGDGGSGDHSPEDEASSGRRAGRHKKALSLPDPKKEDREDEVVPSAPAEPVPEPQEPETAEQAATRRREELKRTAAKAPAKKKRRF